MRNRQEEIIEIFQRYSTKLVSFPLKEEVNSIQLGKFPFNEDVIYNTNMSNLDIIMLCASKGYTKEEIMEAIELMGIEETYEINDVLDNIPTFYKPINPILRKRFCDELTTLINNVLLSYSGEFSSEEIKKEIIIKIEFLIEKLVRKDLYININKFFKVNFEFSDDKFNMLIDNIPTYLLLNGYDLDKILFIDKDVREHIIKDKRNDGNELVISFNEETGRIMLQNKVKLEAGDDINKIMQNISNNEGDREKFINKIKEKYGDVEYKVLNLDDMDKLAKRIEDENNSSSK